MDLENYNKKRKFSDTPEPKGKVSKSHGKLAFVVQKHKASSLHYDFRLELKGVLKSWAVPKGPSLNPKDKHLALMVEDHPYDYRKFEGVIPKGNYGGGQVIIWDEGYYEPREETSNQQRTLSHQLHKGHLTFILYGQKLKGEFALIKDPSAGDNAWLLIKKHDEYASTFDITKQDQSVVSGKRIEDKDYEQPSADVSQQPKAKMPRFIQPMLATLIEQPFDDPDWLYEVKWDGYRAFLVKDGSKRRLYSRTGQDFSDKFKPIFEAGEKIGGDYLIDGEIVAVDKDGKAHFEWLQNWGRAPEGSLQYMVFDIPWFNGRDLRSMSLIERKKVLRDLLPSSGPIKFSDHLLEKGSQLFALADKKKLEGIMAKRCVSSYQDGRRSRDWLKIKTHLRQEVVIGGFTEPKGSREYIGALVVGVYIDSKLHYVCHAGGGIPTELLPKLRKRLEAIEIKDSPFENEFKPNAPIHWVKPKLVCEVSFSEWTSDMLMRQPIFIGLREDKKPEDVHIEVDASQLNKGDSSVKSDLKLSHLDKVFWPKRRYTKGDLVDYYKSVAGIMLPYIKDRPHSMLRQPNGINGEGFFQKDVGHTPPDWVKTVVVYSESNKKEIHYLVCDSLDSLLYMAQLGCIEINPWNSKIGQLDKPDWAVIDLDPEAISFKSVVETALAAKAVCDELDIPSYPKTSGKTGIHIYIPIGAKYTYDQTKQFAQLLATLVNKKLPKITSLVRSPEKRQKKVYLDYLQNRKGQTLAAPYSVRPTPEASVSTPLKWKEVTGKLRTDDFTIINMSKRLDKVGDLWKPVIGPGIDMREVLKRMTE